MSRKKNNVLPSNNGEDLLESIFTSRKFTQDAVFSKKQYIEVLLKKINIVSKNDKQKEFLKTIDNNEITICIGESGVGKSYLSFAKGLDMLRDPNNKFEKIFLITPIIESEGESIGYLKGSLEDKTTPYLYSIYYLIDKIVGEDVRKKLLEAKIIEPIFISYMRGINLDNCITICDESQNISIAGIKTVLTRIGFNTKYIISGDLKQIDRFKKPDDSGLKYIYDNLKDIDNIGIVEFGREHIVRNPIISSILDRF